MKIEDWKRYNDAGDLSPLAELREDKRNLILSDYRRFLSEWLEWAEAGAPENEEFERTVGLCNSSRVWAAAHGAYAEPCLREGYDDREYSMLEKMLDWRFEGEVYPFGANDYSRSTRRGDMHLSPKRLRWVRNELRLLKKMFEGEGL